MAENIITASNEQSKYFPYADKFHLQRSTFWDAGVDSYTIPPAQEPDRFQLLQNIEPVLQGVLKRRRGYQLLSSAVAGFPFVRAYSFRSEIQGIRNIVFSSLSQVNAYTEDGVSSFAIFNPSASAVFPPRMVLSRSFGYFADGAAADAKKWDGNNFGPGVSITNWGIGTQVTNGPNAPGTAADTGADWTNVNNVKVSDAVYATATLVVPIFQTKSTSSIKATNFGFAIGAGATIIGITVEVQGFQDNATHPVFWKAQLVKAGAATGLIGSALAPVGSEAFASIAGGGGSVDPLWGSSWTPADVNAANFGVQVQAQGTGAHSGFTSHLSVDFIRITIFTTAAAIIETPGGGASGVINLLSGRIYTAVGLNSITGTTSDLIPFSLSTGPLTNQNVALSAIPVFSDPQVDQKLILATADGGDETTLFLLAEIPNATTTYTDNTPDTVLLTQPVYQETQADGTLHGVANNKVPPLINFPTKHKGRIYGTIANTLYFSKSLSDVTTSSGTITTKWEEAWPRTFQLDISERAETIQGLLSDGETLWMGTESSIRRLVGDSPANFQEPEIQFNDTGIYNQDTWQVVFSQGQPVGTMWLTPDFKVMGSDFNTYTDVGWPVQDILSRINRNAAQLPWANFVSNGPAEYYMLYIPTGSNTAPDTILVYDLDSKAWFVWVPSDFPTGGVFFFDVNGAPRWTFATSAASSGVLYEWLPNILQDRVNNGPVSYPCSVVTSWLDFGDPTLRKALNQILIGTGDSAMTLNINGASTEADLNPLASPPPVLIGGVLSTGPLNDLFVPLAALVSKYRWYQFSFTSPASTITDVLDFYNVECIPLHRW